MADKERLSLLDGVRKVEDAVDLMTLILQPWNTVILPSHLFWSQDTAIAQILINWHILRIVNYDMKL